MGKLLAPLLLVLLLLPLVPLGHATPKPLRIALVDTGINASLPEFAAGQVVAWKDFTPANSTTPVDGFGHGTATASLAAGLNAGNCGDNVNAPKLSFAPGASLVIARVGDNSGSITGDIEAAIDWAVAQGADVISMSIGAIVPVPLPSAAIQRANAAGVIVVVAAGNGVANFGLVPFPGWSSEFGVNAGAIAVGGGSRAGTAISFTGNSDPDVASWSDNVCVARNTGGYVRESGTSFAAPLVAGMACKAIEIARNNGAPSDAAHVTQLLLYSAKNSVTIPYHREGMGFLLDGQWASIQANAATGAIPNYDAQGAWAQADRLYREQVLLPIRQADGLLA